MNGKRPKAAVSLLGRIRYFAVKVQLEVSTHDQLSRSRIDTELFSVSLASFSVQFGHHFRFVHGNEVVDVEPLGRKDGPHVRWHKLVVEVRGDRQLCRKRFC